MYVKQNNLKLWIQEAMQQLSSTPLGILLFLRKWNLKASQDIQGRVLKGKHS